MHSTMSMSFISTFLSLFVSIPGMVPYTRQPATHVLVSFLVRTNRLASNESRSRYRVRFSCTKMPSPRVFLAEYTRSRALEFVNFTITFRFVVVVVLLPSLWHLSMSPLVNCSPLLDAWSRILRSMFSLKSPVSPRIPDIFRHRYC